MEILGIGFDGNALSKNKKILEVIYKSISKNISFYATMQQHLKELQEEANKLVGHNVLLSSPAQVSKVLFEGTLIHEYSK
jgi:DNA polymerase I-like protein with 3'-5' exonuclease and polymerase domains